MKRVPCFHQISLAFAMFATVPFSHAWDRSSPPAIVTRYCSGCHERDGRSQLPYIPRLAGLSAAYAERRMVSFRDTTSPAVDEAIERIFHLNPRKDAGVTPAAKVHMVGVASSISDQEINASAEWYAAQTPTPGKMSKGRAMEEGEQLFTNGLESKGLRACQSCHGSNAEGTDQAPRLAGQNSAYLIVQLAHFRAGERRDSPQMTGVARNVGGNQARAVALYLQSR